VAVYREVFTDVTCRLWRNASMIIAVFDVTREVKTFDFSNIMITSGFGRGVKA
jgi:hypothetical protein